MSKSKSDTKPIESADALTDAVTKAAEKSNKRSLAGFPNDLDEARMLPRFRGRPRFSRTGEVRRVAVSAPSE